MVKSLSDMLLGDSVLARSPRESSLFLSLLAERRCFDPS
jgi:hypothetical protein